MKLIALVVEKYKDVFERQIFNFSDEFKVDFKWERRELIIEKNPHYIKNFYGESIYNITPIVGINGTGKTSVLKSLIHYASWNFSTEQDDINYLLVFSTPESDVFFVESYGVDLTEHRKNDIDEEEKETVTDFKILEKRRTSKTKKKLVLTDYETDNKQKEKLETFKHKTRLILPYSWAKNVLKRTQLYDKNLNKNNSIFIYRSYKNFDLATLHRSYEKLYNNRIITSKLCLRFDIRQSVFSKQGREKIDKFIKNKDEIFTSLEEFDFSNQLTDADKNFLKLLFNKRNPFIVDYRHAQQKFYIIYINSEEEAFKPTSKPNYSKTYDEYDRNHGHGKSRKIPEYELAMSTGEANILEIVSTIEYAISKQECKSYIFVIDEIETGLHLEWSRKLIKFLTDYINEKKQKVQEYNLTSDFPTFQFIFTTHSPYMLSDIKPGNIIALKKKNEDGKQLSVQIDPYPNTFAKNIQEIMHDDMFISNIYGEFAVQKINKIIDHLNSDDRYDEERRESLEKEILLISEPLIRDKLLDMYHVKYTDEETGKEDEILRLIAGLSDERKAQILEKLGRQQKNR